MPGAEAAVREPWRMAMSYLYKTFGNAFLRKVKKADKALFMKTMIDKGINSPLTSSAGRLFDGAASLILNKEKAAFEAELPMELEKIASRHCEEHYGFDTRDIFRGIVKDIAGGVDRRLVSAKFHNTVAGIIVRTAARLKKRYGIGTAVLSGGVFQNRYLLAKTVPALRDSGFKVYTHSRVSTTDAGIPLGQIAIAHARFRCA
jgi:hydrogenase maturation protein HypF